MRNSNLGETEPKEKRLQQFGHVKERRKGTRTKVSRTQTVRTTQNKMFQSGIKADKEGRNGKKCNPRKGLASPRTLYSVIHIVRIRRIMLESSRSCTLSAH